MKTLKVQIADTPHKLERGLMFVNNLPADEGMLFIFPREGKLNFWGRNTFIPLDIAFVDEKYRIVRIAKIQPMCLSGVDSGVTCRYAIEANDGYFSSARVNVGDSVEIERGETPDEATVRFVRSHNNEGLPPDSRKDNTKQGQVVAPAAPTPSPLMPTVDKPDPGHVGEPIGVQPQMSQLPVMTKQDIGSILEDSFDDEQPDETPEGEPVDEGQEAEPPEQEFPEFQSAQQAVQWAEDNLEVVHISYTTKKGRQLERDVEPHGQFHSDSTKRQILVTFDESVGAIRAFIVSNIGTWRFVGKKFAKKFVVKG